MLWDLSSENASTMLICRFINFIKSIKKSPKSAVRYLYQKVKNNLNIVTGRNIQFVLEASGCENIENMKTSEMKRKLKFCESSAENAWKIKFIKEIVVLKQNVLILDEESDVLFDNEDLEFIVEFLSTS